jgi:hypothetical protein
MRKKFIYAALLLVVGSSLNYSCRKQTAPPAKEEEKAMDLARGMRSGPSIPASSFTSDVIINWLNVQLEMLRVPLAAGTGSQAAERVQAYCGITAYQSALPGMPDYQSLEAQLTDFPVMPDIEKGKRYHWAASVNAALAAMNRKLFPATSAMNKAKIDHLEDSLQNQYASETDANTLQRSVLFGQEVASRIFAWASTDGSANQNPAYTPPVGPGLWVSTPPNFPAAVNPYAYQRRLLVPGVAQGTRLLPPPAYSTDPSSAFFAMVKDVYEKSQQLTTEQTAMALYHRDAPGYPGGGHFVAILSQILEQAQSNLETAAIAYAKSGIAFHDAIIICFTQKYTINLVRPITYIRDVMGYTSWNALFNTPGHPEFLSAHAVNAAANAVMYGDVFGKNFPFTLHTYDYLGLPPRSYNSFYAMAKEMADSRVFAGIHYQASCDKGRWLGEMISRNILRKINFSRKQLHFGYRFP